MARISISAEPELISRRDEQNGRWEVNNCPPERGIPATDIVGRNMQVPFGNDEVARCIRAHEVMHSKVSPGTYWPEWVKRGWATERSMRVVEEARVNNLCRRAGIPVDKVMSDGTERGGAERLAKLGHWDDAVFSLVAMIETAALNDFLKGIKKHQPQWVKPLKGIAGKIVRELNRVPMKQLAETDCIGYELFPAGFRHTERIATWLDSIANLTNEDDQQRAGSESEGGTPAPISEEELAKSGRPSYGDYDNSAEFPAGPAWGKLNPVEAELTENLPGSLARKRKAAQTGRSPRRIHRMLTDPERRIFDVKSRGKGGIVLIDASGSMHFNEDDIRSIMKLAPGALVAIYAEDEDGSSGHPNLHVIARNGKTVAEIPRWQVGNNVDLPALQWAVSQRKSNATPIVWVTDGEVTATDGCSYATLAIQCIDICKRERIIVAGDINQAISVMGDMKTGRKPRWTWPEALQRMHRQQTGKAITVN